MFIYPLFRKAAEGRPGISFIIQGAEIAANPDITVTFTTPSGEVRTLVPRKKMIGNAMFVHASRGTVTGVPVAAEGEGGIGSITVTVTGTTDQITAEVGYGEPGIGVTTGEPVLV